LALIYIGLGVNMAIFLYHGFGSSFPGAGEAAQVTAAEFQTFFRIFPLLPIR
jgi:raffinose/stachyose/melibiose transport system permease protein